MNFERNSRGGASALVATVILAAALVAISCAERAAPAGGERDEDSRRAIPTSVASDGAVPRDEEWLLKEAEAPGAPIALALEDAEVTAVALGGSDGEPMEMAARDFQAGDAGGVNVPRPPAPEKKDKAGGKSPVKTWKRVEATPNTSRLMIGDKEELELKGLQANVRVDGFRARVVLDLFYFNDRDRQFEGTFKLRLPNEASPFLFAFGESVLVAGGKPDEPRFILDDAGQEMLTTEEIIKSRAETWENVKEARMVPKEKAALAYTETVRRRIDPALLEWCGAGVFSARVFPLSPKKLHRIVIGYDVDLLQIGDDLEYRLDLPSGVKSVMVDLDVAELGETPIAVRCGSERGHDREGGHVPIPGRSGNRYVSPDERANGRVRYRIQKPAERTVTARYTSPGTIMLVGKDKTGSYFATKFRPDLPKAEAKGGSSHAVFMVDISLSSNPERMNIWLKLMKAILDGNRDRMEAFGVIFFNVEAFWWREHFVANTPENVKALMDFADGLALEGATDLGVALSKTAVAKKAGGATGFDLFLLSDGAITWGEGDLNALAKLNDLPGPVFAYTTGFAGTDTRVLQHLARETGGAVFSVTGEAEVAAAATAHRSRPYAIARYSVAPDPMQDQLLAGRPRAVFPGQGILAVGRGSQPMAHLTLSLVSTQDGRKSVRSTRISVDHVVSSDLAPRIYGQVATGQLEEFHKLDEATEDAAAAYARHFRVTGQTCSLLMLESEEDYKRYDIKPEEDAFVVKSTKASDLVAKALAAIGDSLADAKKRFMAWVKKLEKMPGFELKLPTALKMALDRMPRASFEVAPKPLRCWRRKWDDVPGPIQEMLVSKKLDYDKIVAEAERRLRVGGHVPIPRRLWNRYVSPDEKGNELPGTRLDP